MNMSRTRIASLAAAAAAAGLLLTACSSGGSTSPGTATGAAAATPTSAPSSTAAAAAGPLAVATTALGSTLVTSKGMTVYFFGSDTKGVSMCSGPCLQNWPAVAAPSPLPAAIPGVTGTLGTLARADGTSQLTVNGLPVYTFSGDSGPGKTSGEGLTAFGAKWWAVSPSGSEITKAPAAATSSSSSGGYSY
jgi:predicted lipoprotein with Yx(FWY)xxD motif